MRRFRIPLALLVTIALMALTTATVAGHNAGCVQTGNGEWVFVGSNKLSPEVPEQNPNSGPDSNRPGANYLDLQPETQGSDQYGARFAADQGNSAVERPNNCPARGTP